MIRSVSSIHLSVSIVLCVIATPARSDFDERYRLDIGTSVVTYDSKIRINSRDGSIDKEIDLEDDLGLSSDLQVGFIKGSWRMADRHRLTLLYVPVKRTSERTSVNDIEIGGDVIKAGAQLGVSVKTHLFDIEYIYSYYKRSNLELGVSAGIYWMNSVTEITAAGEVVYEGSEQGQFRTDFQANQRLVAPLPLLGLSASYAITPDWLLHMYARYFDITISNIHGRSVSLNLKTEYFFTDHLAFGASLFAFGIDVEHSGVVTFNTINYSYDGLQAYLAVRY